MEKYEQDTIWLCKHFSYPNELQIEIFCERVAILMADGKIDEHDARIEALNNLTIC
jgi:hypothetical protein